MDKEEKQLLREVRDVSIRNDEKLNTVIENQKDHSKRIRALELWRWGILGSGGIIVTFRDKILQFWP